MEDEMDSLQRRMENLERRVKAMEEDNNRLASHLKTANKLNDLLLSKLNKEQASNNGLNKLYANERDSNFLYYQNQSLTNIN